MLPTYRTKRYPNTSAYPVSYNNASLNDRLRSRSRLTNLAVFLLAAGFVLSVLLNLNSWLTDLTPALERNRLGYYRSRPSLANGQHTNLTRTPESIENTIERSEEIRGLKHLVLVAGHAIWKGSDAEDRESDDDWVLTPIQRGGSVRTFYKHIERGIQETLSDPLSLLIFSGGQTRPSSPPTTESQSYIRLAISSGLLSDPETESTPGKAFRVGRATTEEFALDSYENLIFGLGRFREVTGVWPERVTVVGFEMKRARFETLHRAAIKYPLERFRYIGIDDEGDTTASYEGERQYGYLPFTTDPYGCHPPLSSKRTDRNPFARYHPYHVSSPEIAELLDWCPPRARSEGKDGIWAEGQVFPHKLPWETEEKAGSGLSWGREND